LGDQVGEAVSGTLYYVPYQEFDRIRALSISAVEQTSIFAAFCRINTLYMIARAGSGHIGSSFSSLDIMSWLLINEVRTPADGDFNSPRDIFFSSKGHDAPGLYNVFIGMGRLDFDLIHTLRKLGGLPGHPDIATPNIVTNTGSLGMGVSKAKGMIFANRLLKRTGNVFVLTGDGELQEGQFWESLVSAVNHKLHELVVIIDHNKLQSDTLVAKVSDLGDLEAKLNAFGWHVSRCDGNDLAAFSKTLELAKKVANKPKVIIADTVKGRGVSFMEHTSIDSDVENYKFHSGAPTAEAYVDAAQELIDNANAKLTALGVDPLELESVIRPVVVLPDNPQRLIQAYSAALIDQARKNPKIVALDADLILDTGLIPFQKTFPNRFIECGIAEQDMVSQAGGMALQGLLPIVHSFACFLSSRPNEQIYNNATEHTKIIYVGSLAGILPGGPGHSHQAVRDISALSAIPGLIMMEPSCEAEVGMLLNWCINESQESSYLRLVSLPWVLPYELPSNYIPKIGRGVALSEGSDVAIIAYGPVLLSSAIMAARQINIEFGLNIKVINLPWLNCVDADWLAQELDEILNIIALDNHYLIGGQGDQIANVLAHRLPGSKKLYRLGINKKPVCGMNAEVLAAHGLDQQGIYELICKIRNLVIIK
jgi:transketolase